jgi:hypothetical protein
MDTATQAMPQELVSESECAEGFQHTGFRSRAKVKQPRAQWANLERACRIALLETEQPASVEAIHDRIVRRGSFVFLSYERAFRAITLAMFRLVRRGEAVYLSQQGEIPVYRRSVLSAPGNITNAKICC